MNHVGKNIKALRHKYGWSQGEVAKALQMSVPALSRIESGQTDVNLSRLVQLAALFKVTLLDLVAELGNTKLEQIADELRACKERLMERDEQIIKLQKALIKMYEDQLQLNSSDAKDF